MIIVDILCVVAVFYLKFYLTRVVMQKNGDVIAEVANAIQIQLLEYIYTKIGIHYSLWCLSSVSFIFLLLLILHAFEYMLVLLVYRNHAIPPFSCLLFPLCLYPYLYLCTSLTPFIYPPSILSSPPFSHSPSHEADKPWELPHRHTVRGLLNHEVLRFQLRQLM